MQQFLLLMGRIDDLEQGFPLIKHREIANVVACFKQKTEHGHIAWGNAHIARGRKRRRWQGRSKAAGAAFAWFGHGSVCPASRRLSTHAA